jgi:hypothetical protein
MPQFRLIKTANVNKAKVQNVVPQPTSDGFASGLLSTFIFDF